MMYYDGHMGYFGWMYMLLFWGILIWFIVWLVNKTKEPRDKTPLQIAQERYAKGELTKKQYEDMRKELRIEGK